MAALRDRNTEANAPHARLGKRGRIVVIAGVLVGLLALLSLMDRLQSGHSRDVERKAAAAEEQLRSAVERFAAAVDADPAMFNRLDADRVLGPVGSFAINRSTGQLTVNRTVHSGGAARCVTVHYNRTSGATETEVNDSLCPSLLG